MTLSRNRNLLFIFNDALSWVAVPGNTVDFLESAGRIHVLGGDKEGMVIGGDFGCLDTHFKKSLKNLLDLSLAQTLVSELRPYTIVPDDAKVWTLPWIP